MTTQHPLPYFNSPPSSSPTAFDLAAAAQAEMDKLKKPLEWTGNLITSFHSSIPNHNLGYLCLFPVYGTPPPLFDRQYINLDHCNGQGIPPNVSGAALQIAALMQYNAAYRRIAQHPGIPHIALDVKKCTVPRIIPLIHKDGQKFPLIITFNPLNALDVLSQHLAHHPKDIQTLTALIESLTPDLSPENPWFPQKELTTFAQHKNVLAFDRDNSSDHAKHFADAALRLISHENRQLSLLGFKLYALVRCCTENPSHPKGEEWKEIFRFLCRLSSSCPSPEMNAGILKTMENGFKETFHLPEGQFLKSAIQQIVEKNPFSADHLEEQLISFLAELKAPHYNTLLLSLALKHCSPAHALFNDRAMLQKIQEALLCSSPRDALHFLEFLSKKFMMPPQYLFDLLIKIASVYRKMPFSVPYFTDIHRLSVLMQSLLPKELPNFSKELGDLIYWIVESTVLENDPASISSARNLIASAVKSSHKSPASVRPCVFYLARQMLNSSEGNLLDTALFLDEMQAALKSMPEKETSQYEELLEKIVPKLYDIHDHQAEVLADKFLGEMESRGKKTRRSVKDIIRKQLDKHASDLERYHFIGLEQITGIDPLPQPLPMEKIQSFISVAETPKEQAYCRQLVARNVEAACPHQTVLLPDAPNSRDIQLQSAKQLNALLQALRTPAFTALYAERREELCGFYLTIAQALSSLQISTARPVFYSALESTLQTYATFANPSTGISTRLVHSLKFLVKLPSASTTAISGPLKKTLLETFPVLIRQLNSRRLTDEAIQANKVLMEFRDGPEILFAQSNPLRETVAAAAAAASNDRPQLLTLHGFLTGLYKSNNSAIPRTLFPQFHHCACLLFEMSAHDQALTLFEAMETAPEYSTGRDSIENFLLERALHIHDHSTVRRIFRLCTKRNILNHQRTAQMLPCILTGLMQEGSLEAAADLLFRHKEMVLLIQKASGGESGLVMPLARKLLEQNHLCLSLKLLAAYDVTHVQSYREILEAAERSHENHVKSKIIQEFIKASQFLRGLSERKYELAACWGIALGIMLKIRDRELVDQLDGSSPLQAFLADSDLADIAREINLKLMGGAVLMGMEKPKNPPVELYYRKLLTFRQRLYPTITAERLANWRSTIDIPLLKIGKKSNDIDALPDISKILLDLIEGDVSDDLTEYVKDFLRAIQKCKNMQEPLLCSSLKLLECSQIRGMCPLDVIEGLEPLLGFKHTEVLQRGTKLFSKAVTALLSQGNPSISRETQIKICTILLYFIKNYKPFMEQALEAATRIIGESAAVDRQEVAVPMTILNHRRLTNLISANPQPEAGAYFEILNALFKFFPLPERYSKVNCKILCDVIKALMPIIKNEGFTEELYEADRILSVAIPKLMSNRAGCFQEALALRDAYRDYVRCLLEELTDNYGDCQCTVYQAVQVHMENIIRCKLQPDDACLLFEAFVYSVDLVRTPDQINPFLTQEDIPGPHLTACLTLLKDADLLGIFSERRIILHKLLLFLTLGFDTSNAISPPLTPQGEGELLQSLVDQLCEMDCESLALYALKLIQNQQIPMAASRGNVILNSYKSLLLFAQTFENFDLFIAIFGELSFASYEIKRHNPQLAYKLCFQAILIANQACKNNILISDEKFSQKALLIKSTSIFLFNALHYGIFSESECDKGLMILLNGLLPLLMAYDSEFTTIDTSSIVPCLLLIKHAGFPKQNEPENDPKRLELLKKWAHFIRQLSGNKSDGLDEEQLLLCIVRGAKVCLARSDIADARSLTYSLGRLIMALDSFMSGGSLININPIPPPSDDNNDDNDEDDDSKSPEE